MSSGCGYCGQSGHPAAECPERLESYFGTPGDPSAAMADQTRTDGGTDSAEEERRILGENDPEAYSRAADRVTADADRDVWVVEENRGNAWSVAAVLTSHQDAQDYIEDARDFVENCPEDAPERFSRGTVRYRHGSRQSPEKLFESWPPEEVDHDDE